MLTRFLQFGVVQMMAVIVPACAAAVPAQQEVTADSPIVRIAELEIDPIQLDAYLAFLREEIETSVRLEPGVLALNAVSLADSATSIRLLEVYASRQDYEQHLMSPHFLKYKAGTADMVKSLKLIGTHPILLCAKSDFTRDGEQHCMKPIDPDGSGP